MKAKINEPKGYLFTYKADIKPEDIKFFNTHRYKLIDTLSIFSTTSNDKYLNDFFSFTKQYLPDNFEIKYLKYNLVSKERINSKLVEIRKGGNDFTIEQNKNTYDYIDSKIKGYTFYSKKSYLDYLKSKITLKGMTFSLVSKQGIDPKLPLVKVNSYNDFLKKIKKNKVLVTTPFLFNVCSSYIKKQYNHTIDYIYVNTLGYEKHKHFFEKHETNFVHVRKLVNKKIKSIATEQERLVCITDDISVKRIKKIRADEIIARFPNKIHLCDKLTWKRYLATKKEKNRKLSVQGDKKNPKLTKSRKERRFVQQKHKMYQRGYFKQYIPIEWVDEKDNVVDVTYKGILSKKSNPKYVPRQIHDKSYYLDRLKSAYIKEFSTLDRRNSKFSKVEKWSTQFMIILTMVKLNKPENEIINYISTCLPGWKTKYIKRFITYLRLTKNGLNYKPNKKTNPIQRYKMETKESHGIQINPLPYEKQITVDYEVVSEDGGTKYVIEQNVNIQGKKIVKVNSEINETVVICSLKDVRKWVLQDEYKEGPECKWTNLIDIVPINKEVVVKVPFKLHDKKKKKKQWKSPIQSKESKFKRHGEIVERKWLKKDIVGTRKYLHHILQTMPETNIKEFAMFIGSTQFKDIVEDVMQVYALNKYKDTPQSSFLNHLLPF